MLPVSQLLLDTASLDNTHTLSVWHTRVQQLKVDGWMKLAEAYELVDDDFTLWQAVLAYVWSRMVTVDEVRDFQKFESLTFVDFLEALGLVAEMKHLPLASDLADAGMTTLQWAQAKASGAPPRLLLL